MENMRGKKNSSLLGISKKKLYASYLNLLRLKEWQVTSTLNITFRERGTCPRKKKCLFWSFSEMRKKRGTQRLGTNFRALQKSFLRTAAGFDWRNEDGFFRARVQCSAVPRWIHRTREVRVWGQGIP